jgi:hypothetical protein
MNPRRSSDHVLLALLVAGLLVTCGCGKAEYERRVMAGVGGLRTSTMLGPAVQIPGTEVTVQLPAMIDANSKAYVEGSPEPNGAGVVNPERLNPPFMKIPGLRVCYEAQRTDDSTKLQHPIYWYVGVVGPQDPLPGGKSIEQFTTDSIVAAFPPPAKPPVSDTVDIAGTQWKRITLTGSRQKFMGLEGGGQILGAVFQLLIGEVAGSKVIIAYRIPVEFVKPTNVDEVIPMVLGSVKVAPAAVAPPAQ